MKVNGSDFETIKTACLDTLKAHSLHPAMVNDTASAWQVFHKACSDGRLNCHALYKTYNDDHIGTALKAIFKR